MIRLREPAIGKRMALSAIYESAGLQVIIDLMEDSCTESENDLIGEVPWSESIQAKQAICHAKREFFLSVCESIDYHAAEARQSEKKTVASERIAKGA